MSDERVLSETAKRFTVWRDRWGAPMCIHDRPLAACAECAPALDAAYQAEKEAAP